MYTNVAVRGVSMKSPLIWMSGDGQCGREVQSNGIGN